MGRPKPRKARSDAVRRQQQIRLLYALGLTPGEIASRVAVSRWTVTNHLREVRAARLVS
jgi:DNA-binding NarL/FixJ family response regulator